jgi:hypothetical protein
MNGRFSFGPKFGVISLNETPPFFDRKTRELYTVP